MWITVPVDKQDYIAHHGIIGQKWGKKNGPPYPLSDDVSTGKSLRKKEKLIRKEKRLTRKSVNKEAIGETSKYLKNNKKEIKSSFKEAIKVMTDKETMPIMKECREAGLNILKENNVNLKTVINSDNYISSLKKGLKYRDKLYENLKNDVVGDKYTKDRNYFNKVARASLDLGEQIYKSNDNKFINVGKKLTNTYYDIIMKRPDSNLYKQFCNKYIDLNINRVYTDEYLHSLSSKEKENLRKMVFFTMSAFSYDS